MIAAYLKLVTASVLGVIAIWLACYCLSHVIEGIRQICRRIQK
jgi:hypothetical protein